MDWPHRPGLAYLTEYTVILGSHDFPNTSGLDAYLAQLGDSPMRMNLEVTNSSLLWVVVSVTRVGSSSWIRTDDTTMMIDYSNYSITFCV